MKGNIINLSDLIAQAEKRDEVAGGGNLISLEFNRDHLLGLFSEFYREHAEKTIKKARKKVVNRVTVPLTEKKEKFLLEVLKNNKNIISFATAHQVSLEKLAQEMCQSLEEFSHLNEQLNLLVS